MSDFVFTVYNAEGASRFLTLPDTGNGNLRLDVTALCEIIDEVQRAQSWRCRICEAMLAWRRQHAVPPVTVAFRSTELLRALGSFAHDHMTHALFLLDMVMANGTEAVEGQLLFGMKISVDDTLGDNVAFELRS